MANHCNCKACRKGLAPTVNKLASSTPIPDIAKQLRFRYGVDVSELALREHFSKNQITPIEAVERLSSEREPINLDELTLDKWGLSMQEPERVVSYLQEKLLVLSLRQMQIVAQQQADVLTGASLAMDKDQVTNLRTLLNLADRFTAISLHANQQQAVKVVQSIGYLEEGLPPDKRTGSKP